MSKINKNSVTTYTTGFNKKDINNDVIISDLKYARLLKNHFNIDYNEILINPEKDMEKLIQKLNYNMDEPLTDPAAITTYLICEASKNKLKVILSGVGGDEIFGGYPRYQANKLAYYYSMLPSYMNENIIPYFVKNLPSGNFRLFRDLKKFIKSSNLSFKERYLGYLTYYNKKELDEILSIGFNKHSIWNTHMQKLDAVSILASFEKMMYLDLNTFTPSLNLNYTDKMSSALQ